MSDLPLDETALQTAFDAYVEAWEKPGTAISARNLLGHAISTYLREARFERVVEGAYRQECVKTPWVPVVQKEPEPTKLPVGTKVQSKNWAKPYGHVVGYDEDLHMPIVKWDGTEDHGPEACKTDEFEVVK